MNREEAIKIINNFPVESTEEREAVVLSIEALEQESCDKCEVANPCLYCKHEFEPKMGRWEPGECNCPVCGEDKFKDLDADIWADWQPKFCSNCGSRILAYNGGNSNVNE